MFSSYCRVIVPSLILALSACGGQSDETVSSEDQEAAEKIVETAIRLSGGGDVDVDLSGDSVRIGDTTMSRGPGARLPDDFPGDIPILDDAELLSWAVNEQEAAFNATWTTQAKLADVLNLITAGMQEQGWETDSTLDTPNQKILGYSKDDRGASFIIAANDERTTITMSTGKE